QDHSEEEGAIVFPSPDSYIHAEAERFAKLTEEAPTVLPLDDSPEPAPVEPTPQQENLRDEALQWMEEAIDDKTLNETPQQMEPKESLVAPRIRLPEKEKMHLEPVPQGLPELLADDLDKSSLIKVINNQLASMENRDPAQEVRLGALTLTIGHLQATLHEFLRLLNEDLPVEEWSRKIRENFYFYEAGSGKNKQVLFTGYYTPVIEASRFWTSEYRYPLYRTPDFPERIRFVGYKKNHSGDDSSFSPYRDQRKFTRKDIDEYLVLKNQNLEIAWLKDDVERFFLHIQGSGILRYMDGSVQGVRYMGSNNYPYRGVGQLMIEDGVLSSAHGSMQGIKRHLRNNPHDIKKYFYKNPRYIFFDLTNGNPKGSGGGEVVGERSIATDKRQYPAGGLAFIMNVKPVLNDRDEIVDWKNFSRFVVDQDTGSAIRGPGRADLYFGTGKRAGVAAGHYMQRGKMYYLIKK
ncbi:MAG: MltA domain-containing protein, partial [Nitrospinales bacterium]